MGKMTASCKAFFAFSKPATSSHFTLGFSVTMAWAIPSLNFSLSLSSPSFNFDYALGLLPLLPLLPPPELLLLS